MPDHRLRWHRGATVLVVAGLVLTACTGEGTVAPGGGVADPADGSVERARGDLLSREADPLDVVLELAPESVTEVIGPEGGVIEATHPEGLVLRLTLPEGAVVVPTEITLTPVTQMVGSGLEEGVGAQLEPHGLTLLHPATLTLELPPGRSIDDLWGISTLAGGEQTALHPVLPADPGFVELPIFGFSSYGAFPGGRANAEDIADRPVTSVGRRVVGEVAMITREYLTKEAAEYLENEEAPVFGADFPWDEVLALRDQWLEEGILPLAEAALDDDIAFLRFEHEVSQLLGLDSTLSLLDPPPGEIRFEEFVDLVAGPIENARDRAVERCKTEHRLGEIGYALSLDAQLFLLGAEAIQLDPYAIVVACARFRLVFQSTISQEGSADGTENRSTSFVAGEVDPVYPLAAAVAVLGSGTDFTIVGTGVLGYEVVEGTNIFELPGGTCEATYVGGEDGEMMVVLLEVPERPQKYGPWSVPEIYGAVAPPPDPPEPAEVRVAIDPGDPIERATGSCTGFEGLGAESAIWDAVFAIRHIMEAVEGEEWAAIFGATVDPEAVLPEQTGFVLDLDEFTGGRIYAAGSWEDCVGGAAEGGVYGETCERTFITLYHEPKP